MLRLCATATARRVTGFWNGIVMVESSARRRILALWLPRLSTDRLQRKEQHKRNRQDDAHSCDGQNDAAQPGAAPAACSTIADCASLSHASRRDDLEFPTFAEAPQIGRENRFGRHRHD